MRDSLHSYKSIRRVQSKCLPPAELILWHHILADRRLSVRFGREILVGDHIVALCCRAARIAIEYDLPPELERTAEDISRVEALLLRGYTIVNIHSTEIYRDPVRVCDLLVSIAARQEWSGEPMESHVIARDSAYVGDDEYFDEDDHTPRPAAGQIHRHEISEEEDAIVPSVSIEDLPSPPRTIRPT
ncbi:MAG: DUF559 domain-containing protein [Capsulimonadaceae bacterium]|nr:DUF559 domain-containing protein [Capsulimonadaceae bacterium]